MVWNLALTKCSFFENICFIEEEVNTKLKLEVV